MYTTLCPLDLREMIDTKNGAGMSQVVSKLTVLAEHEFMRGCLSHWLRACCPELDILMAADIDEGHSREASNPPALIIIYVNDLGKSLDWIEHQVVAKSRYYSTISTVLISDGIDQDVIQSLIDRKVIDAIISTSDTTEIAAAALRLILVGGHYMPRLALGVASSKSSQSNIGHKEFNIILGSDLTARERAVLKLLETGKQNKVIAHELGMSLSTAKIHVHNIIRKMKVKNRMEAVIASGRISLPGNQLIHAATKHSHLNLKLQAGKNGIEIMPN